MIKILYNCFGVVMLLTAIMLLVMSGYVIWFVLFSAISIACFFEASYQGNKNV